MELLTYLDQDAVFDKETYYIDNLPASLEVLLKAKCAKITAEINIERDRREQSIFTYLNKQIQCDPISVQRISVAVATAQLALSTNVPYSVDWSCADNSKLTLDALGVLGMMQALGLHGLAIHYYARSLKDQVVTASDPDTVDIYSGWPE